MLLFWGGTILYINTGHPANNPDRILTLQMGQTGAKIVDLRRYKRVSRCARNLNPPSTESILLSQYHFYQIMLRALRFNSHISTKSILPFHHLQLESWHQLTRHTIPRSRWMKSVISLSPTTAVMTLFMEEFTGNNVQTIGS